MTNDKGLSRRDLLKISAAGVAGVCTLGKSVPVFATPRFPEAKATEFVELPPKNAQTYFTSCRYCHLQCGYKVYVWPKGTGRKPKSERFYPVEKMRGDWPNPDLITSEKTDKRLGVWDKPVRKI